MIQSQKWIPDHFSIITTLQNSVPSVYSYPIVSCALMLLHSFSTVAEVILVRPTAYIWIFRWEFIKKLFYKCVYAFSFVYFHLQIPTTGTTSKADQTTTADTEDQSHGNSSIRTHRSDNVSNLSGPVWQPEVADMSPRILPQMSSKHV